MKAIEKVTQIISNMMEQGELPWTKEWKGKGIVSHSTLKQYSLLNCLMLGCEVGEYITFNQAKKEGGNVKKGAKSRTIFFWTTFTPKDAKVIGQDENGEDILEKKGYLTAYNVFHLKDTEGVKEKLDVIQTPDFHEISELEKVAQDYLEREGISLEHNEGAKAFYRPGDDSITLPNKEQFSSEIAYYSTLFHEIAHSSGHKDRLNRIGENFTEIEAYSQEELVAEITSAMILAEFGFSTEKTLKNTAAYVQGWGKYLQENADTFVKACSKAEKAIAFILGREASTEVEEKVAA